MEFKDLAGKTLKSIMINKGDDDDNIVFTDLDGKKYQLNHFQDCCEYVKIEDICGDIGDIIGNPILVAEEVEHEQDAKPEGVETDASDDSFTWTFYKLDTCKGGVTMRWLGESNGYYSESVSFSEIK